MHFILLCLSLIYPQDWILYMPDSKQFSVYLPELPKLNVQDLDTDIGLIHVTNYVAVFKKTKEEDLYIINHTLYPKNFIIDAGDSTMQYIVETIQEGLMQQLEDPELLYDNIEKMNGIECQIFLIKYQDSLSLKTVIVPFKNNIYTLQMSSNFNDRLNNYADKFFNSFKLKLD